MAKYKLSQVARIIGVAPVTLKRWLLSARVGEVQRDRNGWRVFTEEDVRRIQEYAAALYPPVRPGEKSLFDKRKT